MNHQWLSGLTTTLLITISSSSSLGIVQPVEALEAGSPANVSTVQRQESGARQPIIAEVQAHQLAGQRAATLYVRDIPVLTFLGSEPTELPEASPKGLEQDPVWRAMTVAGELNNLDPVTLDAETITVRWDNRSQTGYVITVGDQSLVTVGDRVILPDTTGDPAKDALQATNRLRRLLGKATPLAEIEGSSTAQLALVNTNVGLSGWASWYGPGFHGNYSANGEIFDQHSMTAAHRSLPFGTMVRVTNLDNGRSIVVRINDRGPFIPGRVIDLSMAAADALGMINSGVAPVRLDVVESR